MSIEASKAVTLTDDELSSYFGDFQVFRNDAGCDMVKIPNEYPDLLPDLVFSRRLPMLHDGSFLKPTEMIPIPLELVETVLGEIPAYAIQAWILFGDYFPDERTLWVTRTTKSCALMKIRWDIRVLQIATGKVSRNEEGSGGLQHETLSERLRGALKFVVNVDDNDYGVHGTSYVMMALNDDLRQLCQKCDTKRRDLLQESAKKLEQFELEKEEWREKILGLIPEDWVDTSPTTRRMEIKADFVRLWVETSPAYWRALVTSRFDEVGYQRMMKTFA